MNPAGLGFNFCRRDDAAAFCGYLRHVPPAEPPLEPVTSLTREELGARLAPNGQPGFRAVPIARLGLPQTRAHVCGHDRSAGRTCARSWPGSSQLGTIETVRCHGSNDTTQKFLFRLADGQLIETVMIPASPALYGEASDRRTLCISTQVGCAYGCKFCASGLNGWTRNLQAGEIVEQILRAEEISGERVNNLVFMGMGEPLANYDNLLRAIGIINAPWGVGLGARHITVSTSGLGPANSSSGGPAAANPAGNLAARRDRRESAPGSCR